MTWNINFYHFLPSCNRKKIFKLMACSLKNLHHLKMISINYFQSTKFASLVWTMLARQRSSTSSWWTRSSRRRQQSDRMLKRSCGRTQGNFILQNYILNWNFFAFINNHRNKLSGYDNLRHQCNQFFSSGILHPWCSLGRLVHYPAPRQKTGTIKL